MRTDEPRGLWRIRTPHGTSWARGPVGDGPAELVEFRLDDVLAGSRTFDVPAAGPVSADYQTLVPLENQDVWAAGVSFNRSRAARNHEAGEVDHYDKAYTALRPELFFKARAGTSSGPGDPIGIRADSGWDVPEPELGLVVNADRHIVAYTIGNDVSSRSIEGENPLYLPQAKVYRHSCAIGPCLVPADQLPPLHELTINLSVWRDRQRIYRDTVALSGMHRTPHELVNWLYRMQDFPYGVLLLTGTSIVPPHNFTLTNGDTVTIDLDGIGTLYNTVTTVGANHPTEAVP